MLRQTSGGGRAHHKNPWPEKSEVSGSRGRRWERKQEIIIVEIIIVEIIVIVHLAAYIDVSGHGFSYAILNPYDMPYLPQKFVATFTGRPV